MKAAEENRRVLVIDDDPAILKLYQEILTKSAPIPSNNYFNMVEAPQTEAEENQSEEYFGVSVASSGQEGIELACAAHDKGSPFPIAFIDMRMPPGIDGLETARNLRKLSPWIYIIIVTAYSDRTIDEIQQALEHDVIFLQKPFVHDVIFQLARTLCRSWNRDRALERAERREKYGAFQDGLSEMSSIVLDNIGNMILGVESSCNRVIETCQQINKVGDTCRDLSQELDLAQQKEDLNSLKKLNQQMIEVGRTLPDVLDRALWPSHSSLDSVQVGIEHIIKVLNIQRGNTLSSNLSDNFSMLQLIDDLLLLISKESKRAVINIEPLIESSLYELSLPRNKLLNTLINLTQNSIESIQSRIKEKALPPSEGKIILRVSIINNQLNISIEDNGSGIDPSIHSQIFEFGYSTKQGHSGFGLHAAGNFIGSCKGSIKVKSEGNNQGTQVHMTLPTII